MKKKIVFLPYDFDTAIGINNEPERHRGFQLPVSFQYLDLVA